MQTLTKVLVVGGGPAGSVAATALAREGLDVVLVEKARFPRYHVGESLTPSCVAILDAIGVADKLDRHGFLPKHGATFRWDADTWIVDWGRQVGSRAWQVDRSEFDLLLLDHARANGVKVIEGVAVTDVSFAKGRPVSVRCVPGDGKPFTIDDFDFLIDASGRAGLLSARHLDNRRPLENLRNIAAWSYWSGADLLPGTPSGGINVVSSSEGWFWVIPLAQGRSSIGYVTSKDAFARHRRGHASTETMYRHLLSASPLISGLTTAADHVGPVRVETDYSYIADRFGGHGYLTVGDAACFLDPLLSTGVHLALFSALIAGACIASLHRGEVTEPEALGFFEFAFRRAYTRLFALVSVMYERYIGREGFFHTSDRLIHGTSTGLDDADFARAFAELIGGLPDLREATDTTTRVLTDHLAREALHAQHQSINADNDPARPDFTAVLNDPLTEIQTAHHRLVTTPRLGLQPTPAA